MDAETWIMLLAFALVCALLIWRYQEVQKPRLDDQVCMELASKVTQAIFGFAGAANQLVPIQPSFWREELELTDAQWIYLCRWMSGRGWTATPSEWGWIEILSGTTPRGLALTPRSWNLQLAPPNAPSVWIAGDNLAPINFSGHQIVISGVQLSVDDLTQIVNSLRQDAQQLPPLDASHALAAASSLQRVVDGSLPPQDPEVRGTLEWVKARAGEAIGNAAGTAFYAATAALLRASGII